MVNEHEIAAADQAVMKKVSGPVLAYAQLMKTDHAKNLVATTRLGGAASTAPAVTGLHDQGEADLKALAAVPDGGRTRRPTSMRWCEATPKRWR